MKAEHPEINREAMSLEKPSKLLRKKNKSLKIEVFKILKVIKTLLSLMLIYLFISRSFLKRPPLTTLIKTAPYPIFFYFFFFHTISYTIIIINVFSPLSLTTI